MRKAKFPSGDLSMIMSFACSHGVRELAIRTSGVKERQMFSWTKEQFVGLGKVSFDVGFGFEIGWVVVIGAKLAYLFSSRETVGKNCLMKRIANYRSSRSFHDVFGVPSSLKETVIS